MGTLSQSLFIPLIVRLIAFHRGIECYRICYARVVLILSPSPWDLLWDLYRLPYRSVAPSLSTQLIAFHRENHCYCAHPIRPGETIHFQSPFRRGSNERLANAIESLTA